MKDKYYKFSFTNWVFFQCKERWNYEMFTFEWSFCINLQPVGEHSRNLVASLNLRQLQKKLSTADGKSLQLMEKRFIWTWPH